MTRKFSIPFTWNADTTEFIQYVKEKRESIDSVYFSLPYILGVDSHFTANPSLAQNSQEVLDFRDIKTVDFVAKSYQVVKRVALLNAVIYSCSVQEYEKRMKEIVIPFLQQFKIEAVVVTHFFVARWIKEALPEIEIQTSCNDFQFTLPQMKIWREELGVELFNPPREAARMPGMLKQFHDAGFKLKVLVNDTCLFGCPYHVAHAAMNSIHGFFFRPGGEGCTLRKPENFFKSNWVLPRWLPLLDDTVDVYKIVGRGYPLELVTKITDAYIELNDAVSINELVGHTGTNYNYFDKRVPCSVIPDKLLSCQRMSCDSCRECDKLTKEWLL